MFFATWRFSIRYSKSHLGQFRYKQLEQKSCKRYYILKILRFFCERESSPSVLQCLILECLPRIWNQCFQQLRIGSATSDCPQTCYVYTGIYLPSCLPRLGLAWPAGKNCQCIFNKGWAMKNLFYKTLCLIIQLCRIGIRISQIGGGF